MAVNLAFADVVSFGIVLLDQNARVLLWNKWIGAYSAVTAEQAHGKTLQQLFGQQSDPRFDMAIREAIDFGWSALLSHTLHPMPLPLFEPRQNARERIKQGIEILPLAAGVGDRGCVIIIHNLTETVRREQLLRKQARQLQNDVIRLSRIKTDLERSELRFRELTRHAPVGLFELDVLGNWTYLNAQSEQILGVEAGNLLQLSWLDILSDAERQDADTKWRAAHASANRFVHECRHSRTDRANGWLRLEASAIRDEGDRVTGYIGTIQDMTEFHARLQHTEYRAAHDQLTGLVTRARFESRLRSSLAAAAEEKQSVAVLFIDLNDFKIVNDQFGHAAGDALLKVIGSRLRRVIRTYDVAARYGGDEFALIINEIETGNILPAIVGKIRQAVSLPVNVGDRHVRVGCAIGVAMFPAQAVTPEELIRLADEAMYADKTRLKGTAEKSPDAGALVDA